MRPCDECGVDLGPADPSLPKSTRSWCSEACADKATANELGWRKIVSVAEAEAVAAELSAAVSASSARYHVHPLYGPEHVTDGAPCWCAPTTDADGICIHREPN